MATKSVLTNTTLSYGNTVSATKSNYAVSRLMNPRGITTTANICGRTVSQIPTSTIVGFSHKRNLNDVCNSLSLTVIDDTAIILESLLMSYGSQFKRPITYQYGYSRS